MEDAKGPMISALKFTVRTHNCLTGRGSQARNGVPVFVTVQQLEEFIEKHGNESLTMLPNLGDTSRVEIVQKLKEFNAKQKKRVGPDDMSRASMAGTINALEFINKVQGQQMARQVKRIFELCKENAELGGKKYKQILRHYEREGNQ